eukprot:jgi/Orpsp1_1/1181977/evm.model.c7180000079371.2
MIKKLESESHKSMVDRKCMNDKININKMMKKTLKMNENDNNEIQRSKRAGKLINDKYDKNQMKDNIFETTKCNKIAVDKYKFNMKDKKGIVKEEINNNNIVNKKSKIGKKCKNKEIDESKENKTIINEKKKTKIIKESNIKEKNKIIKESNIKEKLINLTKQENKFIGIQTEYKTPLNKQPEKRYRLRCYEPKLIPKIEIEDERLKNSIIQKTLDSKERTNIVKKNRLNHLKDGNTADKIKNIFSNLPLFINKEKNEINNEKIDNEFTISKRKIDDEDNNDGCSNDILEVKNEYKIKDEKENDSCMEDCLYNYISRSRNIKLKSYMNTINMLKDPLKYYPINKLKKGQNYYTCLDTLLSFKKDYLTCGFYSNEYRSGIKRRKITSSDEIKYIDELKRKFKFPSLLYYGEVILNKVKDFEVPIDIYLLTKDPHFKKFVEVVPTEGPSNFKNITQNKINEKYKLIPYTEFYNDAINEQLEIKEDYPCWKAKEFSFCSYPFILNPLTKSDILKVESMVSMRHELQDAFFSAMFSGITSPYLVLEVRRDHLIRDVLYG